MKKINKFWKLFNKDSNHKTVTEENSETPQATTESPQPTKEEETEHSENTQNTKESLLTEITKAIKLAKDNYFQCLS